MTVTSEERHLHKILNRLFAIGLFDININSDVFYSWVTQVLIPVLPKNSVIVMDNATFHKKHNIQQVIIDAGYSQATLF
ncbi:transposase [Symbiopectobacterium sp. RP]|uniref:transposase n=1 Tax=Symbiopectobacterium sp. RP TaxID=3248553 RepID=UPI003D2B5208